MSIFKTCLSSLARNLQIGTLSNFAFGGNRNARDLRKNARTDCLCVDLLDSNSPIPPDWIVDELREAERVSLWENAADYMATVKRAYRRDNWQDQARYGEVWSEKATVLGSLRPITQEYGVMLRACRGFGSTGMESQVGNLFEGINKPITVFYLGDHDPSGHDIERDIHRRAQAASARSSR